MCAALAWFRGNQHLDTALDTTLHCTLSLHLSIVCRYYMEKMQAPPGKQDKIIRDIVASYVEGLCWVMRYYYEGVASWEW